MDDTQRRGTVTIQTPDLYGGAAVTTKNVVERPGGSWTQVNGAATFDANGYEVVKIVFGIGDANTEDDAEPYGCIISSWEVPCEETPIVSAARLCCDKDNKCGVVDDSVATDLTATATDPDDGNTISGSDPVDIDAADIKTIRFKFEGAFEEDFGNRFCEDDMGEKNVVVVRYNTSQYDDAYVTDTQGNRMASAPVSINRLLTSSSGYTDATFYFPVIRSNGEFEGKLVLDADDTVNPDGGQSNVTIYLYDVNVYLDNDVTPAEPKCGIMDEDGNEVGAAAADSLLVVVTDD